MSNIIGRSWLNEPQLPPRPKYWVIGGYGRGSGSKNPPLPLLLLYSSPSPLPSTVFFFPLPDQTPSLPEAVFAFRSLTEVN